MQVTFLTVMPVVALLLMQLSACEYFRAIRDLTVELPRLPEPWKHSLHPDAFRISFLDFTGSVCTRTADGQQKLLEIETQKGFVIPVVAEPLVNGLRLPPSGGLYPIDSGSDGTLVLKWESGFVCVILLELARQGIALDFINTERLCNEIEARSRGDPFSLDKAKILESLASGRFRVTDIKPLPSRIVTLIPGAGTWITESPFSPLYDTREGEILDLSLSYGYHHLIHQSNRTHYDIHVTEKETVIREGSR